MPCELNIRNNESSYSAKQLFYAVGGVYKVRLVLNGRNVCLGTGRLLDPISHGASVRIGASVAATVGQCLFPGFDTPASDDRSAIYLGRLVPGLARLPAGSITYAVFACRYRSARLDPQTPVRGLPIQPAPPALLIRMGGLYG